MNSLSKMKKGETYYIVNQVGEVFEVVALTNGAKAPWVAVVQDGREIHGHHRHHINGANVYATREEAENGPAA